MLSNGVESWTDQWKREGLEQGLAHGLERGLAQGLEQGLGQGREQGLEQGREQGLEQGLEQGRQETRHLLTRLARRRFGAAIAAQAEPLLTAIYDPGQLETLGDALLSCHDGAAWLHVLRQARPTHP